MTKINNKEKKKKGGTQDFVLIKEIRGPIVILRDGSLRAVLEAESLNFDLKSTDEKTAIIRGFQDFINIIDFPIQIAINSRQLDLSEYVNKLNTMIDKIQNELLRVQAIEYSRFVKGLTELYNIVSKRFFIVVPYYSTEMTLGSENGFKDKLKGLLGVAGKTPTLSDKELDRYATQLEHRITLIRNGIEGLGIKTKILDYDSLAYLYRSYYNPRSL